MTVLLWGLLILVIVTIVLWAAQADWSTLRYSYCKLPDEGKRGLSLLATTAALLALRGIALLVIAHDTAIISVATGWFLATAVVMLVLRWPR